MDSFDIGGCSIADNIYSTQRRFSSSKITMRELWTPALAGVCALRLSGERRLTLKFQRYVLIGSKIRQ